MDIAEKLRLVLVPALPDLDGRIYPLTMPQDTHHKCLVYKIFGDNENSGFCGLKISSSYSIQIEALAKTYKESRELKDKTIAALRNSDIKISNVSIYETYEDFTLKYRQIIDFRVSDWVAEDVWVNENSDEWVDENSSPWTTT